MKYVVEFYDFNSGATSAIDTVETDQPYTAEQYIADCKSNADEAWNAMLENGEITLVKVEE